ncbi:MAG: hypothetical protein FJ087_18630 [Deltaproteobacteria bacterium]|nr:hypothetical protein [Deltaproteobacteria bacterium]
MTRRRAAGAEPLPFLAGAYVATAAVPGVFLVVDGPYCIRTKADVQYAHDLGCDLLRPVGRSRVVLTDTSRDVEEVTGLALDRVAHVERVLATVARWPEASAVVATSIDFHEVTGFPLGRVAARVAASSPVPVLHLPSRSLGGDWLEGYAGFCECLAGGLDLPAGPRRREAVLVVGHLMDRGEPDQVANVAELERLLNGLGAEAAGVWLSGSPIDGLAEAAARAGTVVALPYARETAATVARRTGAALVEAPLPVGLSASEAFVRAIAEPLGTQARATAFVEDEVGRAIRDTERHVARFLASRPVRVELPDPVLASALVRLCEDMGIAASAEAAASAPRPDDAPAGLVLSNGLSASRGDPGYVPVGYPNYLDHPVLPRPMLGFAGYRCLVGRMCEAALRTEA